MPPICSSLTCSCSSARRVARSSSESELELDESALLSLLSVLLLTTAVADVPPGDEGSAGSSGILAKRISNTSYRGSRARVRQRALRTYEEIFTVHYFLPEVSLPWQQPRDQADYIYSNLRTLTGHLLQSSVRLGTLCCPFFSGKKQHRVSFVTNFLLIIITVKTIEEN